MMEYKRLTVKTPDCFAYDLKDHKHKPKEFNDYDAFFAYSMAVKRLGELEEKIEQGYIKILPVKAGDQIYVVPSKANYGINRMHKTFKENNRVYTQTVDEIRFFKDGVYMVYSCEYQQNHHSEFFGETWFLEYEQAANRLKEMEAIYAKYD